MFRALCAHQQEVKLYYTASHSVGSRPVRTGRPPTGYDDTRRCIIQFDLLIMSTTVLETCRGIHSFISIQPWRPGLAGTRAQSYYRYGSGTLHPGQVLGGSLSLLSPAFRRSHFSSERWNCGRERCSVVMLPEFRLPRKFRDLLHAANLRHGTDGSTSPPKKGVLRIFSPQKSDGFGRVWTRKLGY